MLPASLVGLGPAEVDENDMEGTGETVTGVSLASFTDQVQTHPMAFESALEMHQSCALLCRSSFIELDTV